MRFPAAHFVNAALNLSDHEPLFMVSWRRNHLFNDLFPPAQTLSQRYSHFLSPLLYTTFTHILSVLWITYPFFYVACQTVWMQRAKASYWDENSQVELLLVQSLTRPLGPYTDLNGAQYSRLYLHVTSALSYPNQHSLDKQFNGEFRSINCSSFPGCSRYKQIS